MTTFFTSPTNANLVPLGLVAARRSPRIPASEDIYAPLIGDWTIRSVVHRKDGTGVETHGQWSFRWVLNGSAIEDVIGADTADANGIWQAGIALRFYDDADKTWRVTYVEPFTRTIVLLTARKVGHHIIQTNDERNTAETWTFEEMTPQSFYWVDRVRQYDGTMWVQQEIFATRSATPRERPTE